MKKNLLLTTCLLAASAAVFWSIGVSGQKAEAGESARTEAVAAPQAITVEDFTYATGALTLAGGANTSGGNWVNFSGTGNFIPVSSGSLSYTGYPSTGVGNKVDIISVASSAEDAHRQFATQGVGSTTYAAFMLNVANTTGMLLNTSTTGDYFAGFLPSTSTTLLNARVSIRQGAVSGFNLGLRATSANATASFAPADLATGTTHLVVISYQVVAGDSNDVVRMWINPVITGPEPAADLTQTTASATDIVDIARFFVRQAATTTPNASLDGVRVSNNWANLITAQPQQHVVDTDGDGRTDHVVVRNTGGGPSGQITWFSKQSTGPPADFAANWGIASDQFVPEDYDGDNKTDIAIWRPIVGTNCSFYILQSATSTVRAENFGQVGDQPDVVGDYNGDGSADLAVYRPGATAGAPSTWFYRTAANGPVTYVPWGQNGDFPSPGDYDGDGMNDFVIQRNAGGGQAVFWTRLSTGATSFVIFGTPTDVIVPGDYDGDGKTDLGVIRGSGGQILWAVLQSSGGAFQLFWGNSATDFPAMGDYDGDGKTDFAVWRPSADPAQNFFHVLGSTAGYSFTEWGSNGDYPVANFNTH